MHDASPSAAAVREPAVHSYRRILQTSALIGGSAAIETGVGLLRTKAMALLLGPGGYGLLGTYGLVVELTRTLAQLGINASGVRQIALAESTGEAERIGRMVTVLRRLSLACAIGGALGLAAFAGPISTLTFGDTSHRGDIALLAPAVFAGLLASGQTALLQGLRRIGDLARVAIVGSIAGALVGVPVVWVWGREGVVPTLVVAAVCSLATSWWCSRRIAVAAPAPGGTPLYREAGMLMRLGLAFLGTSLLMSGAVYAVRIIVLRGAGLESAGIYQAASALAALSTGFVIQALGTDFYPRLVALAGDDAGANRLVNEQTRICLLLAMPGLLATLTFASLAIEVLYSARFLAAAEVVRWLCLGMALRVLVWPAGTVVIAKNRQVAFVAIELAWVLVNVGSAWWWVGRIGVAGAGVAFFIAYAFHAAVVWPVVRRLSGLRWSADNLRSAAAGLALLAVNFCAWHWLPAPSALACGVASTGMSVWLSSRALVHLAAPQRVPRAIRRLLRLQEATP